MFNFSRKKSGLGPVEAFKKTVFRQMIYFVAVFFVAVTAIPTLHYFVISEIAGHRAVRAERQWIIDSFAAVTRISADRVKAETIKDKLEGLIPLVSDVPTVVVPRVRALARNHNLRLDMQLGNESPAYEGGPGGVDFSIRADGTVSDIIGFLSGLENEKLIRVIRFDLAPLAGSTFQLTFGGKMVVRQLPVIKLP